MVSGGNGLDDKPYDNSRDEIPLNSAQTSHVSRLPISKERGQGGSQGVDPASEGADSPWPDRRRPQPELPRKLIRHELSAWWLTCAFLSLTLAACSMPESLGVALRWKMARRRDSRWPVVVAYRCGNKSNTRQAKAMGRSNE